MRLRSLLFLAVLLALPVLVALVACSSIAAQTPTATPQATAAPTSTATPTATATATRVPAAPPGAISGNQLMYPADSMPALAIYAISTTDSHTYFSTVTSQGQFSYTISGVAPGTYDVVAYLANGTSGNWKELAGGYTQFVVCGLSGSCSDHTLIPVTVQPGQTVSNINPSDFYGGTYPPRPGS